MCKKIMLADKKCDPQKMSCFVIKSNWYFDVVEFEPCWEIKENMVDGYGYK